MDKALYTALSGATRAMHSQRMHANNLANITTDGFRADYLNAVSSLVEGEGEQTRVHVANGEQWTDLSNGQLSFTGRDLDVAIQGDGWLTVVNDEGEEAYTRDGSFFADADGVLRNAQGWMVAGQGGPIQLPDYEKLTIGADGRVSVVMNGAAENEIVMVDVLRLVNPQAADLAKGGDGLFRVGEDVAVPEDAAVTVVSGYLEGSNTNAVAEMVAVTNLSRNFEMQLKMMSSVERIAQAGDELLRR
ncbi:hypothetical protein GZ77_06170 [Endozoicomonas montiporae]|uniref:Flagellar basal-body rod protein FlgF n=2 Tax=Endozoicomonas montiporae TaxID=1027273 RepID=A0A081NC73_9GAMM|nr:flagellar basal body rod protein FlgF [Endozoicomonas montiporae]AMO56378.1 flagellar basal-body rod protein FlgF [Endozoicomonas montiporae CL-33]KEQ16046.1 hypothetical protein GZ77_06170 [Endozoicomonas montiporae]